MREIPRKTRTTMCAMNMLSHPVHIRMWLLGAAILSFTLLIFGNMANASQPAAARDRIVALAFDPASRSLLKATAKSLSRSSDGGQTWMQIALPPAMQGNIAAVAVSTRNHNALYIAVAGLGVLRSKDGGRSWTAETKGLPSRKVLALSSHAQQADTVYAYVGEKGIFRSQDGGANWRLMDRGPRDRIVHFVHSNMAGSMETGWLFAATPKGVRRSMDCFCGWHQAGNATGKFHAVSFDRAQPERLYAAARNGLFVSADGGEQWVRMKSPAPLVTALVVMPSDGIYAATGSKLFRTRDHGATWERIDG